MLSCAAVFKSLLSKRNRAVVLGACALLCLSASGETQSPESRSDHQDHLRSVREEIVRLSGELEILDGQAKGILGELERLGGELRLREAELREASLRLKEITRDLDGRSREIERLSEAHERRHSYLSFRVREMYKRGPVSGLRRLVDGKELDGYLESLRYAAYLSERDVVILEQYRADTDRLSAERSVLEEKKQEVAATRAEAQKTRRSLARSRSRRARLLERVRMDQRQREEALGELEAASRSLSLLVEEVEGDAPEPAMDVRKFRGVLNWPVKGKVSAGFGNVVHPRFKTTVPHPGLDIEADEGDDFGSVFEGRVVYASWLHGYGLTVIVDHGNDMLSIYAHASVLMVGEGESVFQGQTIGKVWETGSLRGPYLYLEVRDQGAPVDPTTWLKRRGGP